MIEKIGIQNFRVFKDYTEFEIKPLTILSGPNNSGKSSFTKLLRLLKNGVEKLSFENGSHNLEDFDSVLNWQSDSKELIISISDTSSILGDNHSYQYSYINIENNIFLNNLSIFKNNIKIFENKVSLVKHRFTGVNENFSIEEINFNVKFNIKAIFDIIYNMDFKVNILKCKNLSENEIIYSRIVGDGFGGDGIRKNINVNKVDKYKYAHLSNNYIWTNVKLNEYNTLLIDPNDTYLKKINKTCLELIDNIKNLEINYSLFDIIIFNTNCTHKYLEQILTIQNEVFEEYESIEDINSKKDSYYNNESLAYIGQKIKDKILLKLSIYGITEENIVSSMITNMLFNKDSLPFEFRGFSHRFDTKLHFKDNFITSLYFETNLKNTEYLSANRGNQKRVLSNKSENDIDEIVVNFYNKFAKNNLVSKYFTEILEILEIEGTLEVERFENVISLVYLKNNDRKINLSDLGFGFSQLLPIIMKISTFKNTNQIIIIEEPEANLHPNLQSKLADIFAVTLKYFPAFKFIIETHSEYFIRKLQYLVAKKEFEINDTVIYYFNADKYVTRDEPKVKRINIKPNGNLSDNFGTGFFDETTQLQFDLMKINKVQNN
jgi:predicted ATPase